MSDWLIYRIGFLAQILFSSRLLVQWITSEKQKQVVTPVMFWSLSLFASFLLFIYGYLRDDFAIMFGQTLTYFIYIRNLQLQNQWNKIPKLLRWFLFVFPLLKSLLENWLASVSTIFIYLFLFSCNIFQYSHSFF